MSFLFWLENIETILQFSFLLVTPRVPVYFVLFRLKQNFRSCQFLLVIRCCAQAHVTISSQIFSWSARPNSVNKSILCLHYSCSQPSRCTVYLTPRCFQESFYYNYDWRKANASKQDTKILKNQQVGKKIKEREPPTKAVVPLSRFKDIPWITWYLQVETSFLWK